MIHSITIKYEKISEKEIIFNLWINGNYICKSQIVDEEDFYDFLTIIQNGCESIKIENTKKMLKIIEL